MADIDRHLRGASHGTDLDFLFGNGARLLVLDGAAYAVLGRSRLLVLGAYDEAGARTMLRSALASMAEAASTEGRSPTLSVEWLTASQQWALEVCAELGMAPHAMGAVMVRGRPGPLSPYVLSGGLG
ncbi:MAG TPA: hypothetical protein VMU09_00260 [Acidimicrobiales bacterium]|nr:hypothetical protein [Acidimicrobiales bacterium]